MHVKVYMRAPGFLRGFTVPGTIEIRALPIFMNHGSLNLHSGGRGAGRGRVLFLSDAKLRVEFFPSDPPGPFANVGGQSAAFRTRRELQYFTPYTDW